jgi:hypothetical protein
MIIDSKEQLQWRKIESIAFFIIWRERCNQMFREQHKSSTMLIREILLECKE